MNALLYWLHLGLAAYLAFMPVQVRPSPDKIEVTLETKRLLTEDMGVLASGGLNFEFELYISLKAKYEDVRSELSVRRIRRALDYDYLSRKYIVYENGKKLAVTDTLSEAENSVKKFESITFQMRGDWTSASLFAELSVLDSPLLIERFGKRGSDLWGGYRPSVTLDIINPEAQNR
jgi:hypothetical protein